MPSNIHVNANSHSRGNSLVELVVVVTMLGVISSFAIPRFTHHENDVRGSKTDAPAHARCAVQYLASPVASGEATRTDLKSSGC
jgi:prepilin-type N-terminal cleavage/methylation domain-containing protein